MKSLLGKLGVILIGLLIFVIGCQKTVLRNESTKGADWKLYRSTESYLGYYDTQSITRPSQNIVRFWVRFNWTEKGVLSRVGKFGGKYENLSHSIDLREINCVEETVRSLSTISYDNKGGVIYSSSSPSNWGLIPASMGESLYKAVCK